MTGIEVLKEKMIENGCTKQQTESKLLGIVLSILGDNPDILKFQNLCIDISKKEADLRKMKSDIADLELRKVLAMKEISECLDKRSATEIYNDVILKINECNEKIDKFFQALKGCETASGRDHLRRVQMFMQGTEVNTKYDNTAYIIGLASILSQDGIAPIEELSKINTKLPDPRLIWEKIR